jgi:cell wall integrity and stress response component
MKSILLKVATAAVSMSMVANAAPEPFVTVTALPTSDYLDNQPTGTAAAAGLALRTLNQIGCFSDPGDLIDMGPYTFQAKGWCQPLCVRLGKPILAFVNGTNCFCGDKQPDSSSKVDDDNCNLGCTGYPLDSCKYCRPFLT